MNDKQKQIEEIAKIMNYCCNVYDEKGNHIRNKCNTFDCEYYCDTNYVCCSYNIKEATALYEQGYRKIDEGSVVLTQEEYENEIKNAQKQAVKEVLSELKKVWEMRAKEHCTLLGNKVQAVTLDLIIEDINETAKEFGVEL